MLKRLGFSFLVVMSIMMCGCTTEPTLEENNILPVEDKTFQPAREIREIHYDCNEFDCKSIAAANLLETYGYDIYDKVANGSDGLELIEQYYEINPIYSWEDIVNCLENNTPVLFKTYHPPILTYELKIAPESYENEHWVVLYDIDEEFIYISDSMGGFVTSEIITCEDTWHKCGEQAFVIAPKKKDRNIKIYYQYPEYPAGCELASTCQVLRYYGYNTSIEDLLYTYLPVSNEEWVYSYYGDIYSSGFAFPNAIDVAVTKYIKDNQLSLRVEDISKCSWEKCKKNVQNNIPLIVWYTIDNKEPRWSAQEKGGYTPWWNLHCIVVYKIENNTVYIADPIEGFVEYDEEYFKNIWQKCGSYAIKIA